MLFFFKIDRFVFQYFCSSEFFIGQSTSEIPLLLLCEAAPLYIFQNVPLT